MTIAERSKMPIDEIKESEATAKQALKRMAKMMHNIAPQPITDAEATVAVHNLMAFGRAVLAIQKRMRDS
jgi:hypothetical protein